MYERTKTRAVILHEATLSLYRADQDGNPLLDAPVWMGARAENVSFPNRIEEVEIPVTGADGPEYAGGHEYHEVRIERIWAMPMTLPDYAPTRDEHVLMLYWEDGLTRRWLRRTYYGVKGFVYDNESPGVVQFKTNQVFRPSRLTRTQGTLGSDGQELPAAPSTDLETPLLFTHDDAVAAGDYLLGVYQFDVEVSYGFAKLIGQKGAQAPVIELEVNGALTGNQLSFASGSGEGSDSETFVGTVTAGQPIRFKVVSGAGASLIGVTLNVR